MALHDWIPQQPGSSGPRVVLNSGASYADRASGSFSSVPSLYFPLVSPPSKYLNETLCRSDYQPVSAAVSWQSSRAATTLGHECSDLQA